MRAHSLLLLVLAPLTHAVFNLTIIHTNDMHGRIDETSRGSGVCSEPGQCYGGFARIKFLADTIRQRESNVLFLNAGDNFQGGTLYTAFKEKIMEKFIDMLGIDVMSLGNHEFDEGPEHLASYLKTVKTPTVAANIDYTLEPSFNGANLFPWLNVTVGGVQIAVVGYVTPDTKFLSVVNKMKFLDEIPSIRKAAQEAKGKGAKIVIALGHSGFEKDREIGEKVEEIDLVVGGHSHSFFYTGSPPDLEIPVTNYPHIVTQSSGKKVPIVQAYAYTKYMGRLHLSFDNNFKLISYSGSPILLNSTYEKDPMIEDALKPWEDELLNKTSAVIGETRVDLDAQCRLKECNFGNLLADALVHTATAFDTQYLWTPAPIAVINGGNIRASITETNRKGQITMGDIMTSIPFEDTLYVLEVTGKQLLEVLEVSVENYSLLDPRGGFLQFSGVRIVYDLTRPPHQRVEQVHVRCGDCSLPKYENIKPNEKYRLITTSYLRDGGDNYEVFKEANTIKAINTTVLEAFSLYVNKTSPVYPGEEDRITLVTHVNIGSLTSSANSISSWPILSISVIIKLLFSLIY